MTRDRDTAMRCCVLLLACVAGCGQQEATRTAPPVRLGPTIVDDDAPEKFTKTDSGLEYRILRKSNGPKPHAMVEVHYTGFLEDGTVFTNSYNSICSRNCWCR